ncbi:hypothetical protein T484DRAFT_2936611 [Baffinella frigidus]|nr:hypothetical protein T484DRAFT_2936611 [Cryptophyta sp. CCMP2293]
MAHVIPLTAQVFRRNSRAQVIRRTAPTIPGSPRMAPMVPKSPRMAPMVRRRPPLHRLQQSPIRPLPHRRQRPQHVPDPLRRDPPRWSDRMAPTILKRPRMAPMVPRSPRVAPRCASSWCIRSLRRG